MPQFQEYLDMDWHPSPHVISHYFAEFLPSEPRAGTTESGPIKACTRGAHILINITELNSPSLQLKIQGYFEHADIWYDLIDSPEYTSPGAKVIKIHPEITASTNRSSSDFLPGVWRICVISTDNASNTFSVEANMVV